MRGFGDLEAQVMDRLWAATQPLTVRAVLEDLNRDRRPAYTTVMTVMDNLHRKGWLIREMIGRAWYYTPVRSRESYCAELMREALVDSGNRNGTLVAFLDQLTSAEARQLAAALEKAKHKPLHRLRQR